MSLLLSALFSPPPQAVDPYRLAIGRRGEQKAAVDSITNLETSHRASAKDIAAAARGKRFVYLGESHATAPHQQLEADVIQALADDGREVVVGLEMYTRPKQNWLDQWSAGTIEEADFLTKSDWKGQWGYDFAFYQPVFKAARRAKLPMVALNLPRDWVRAVGRDGYGALTTEQRLQLPSNLGEPVADHRAVFNALMGDHPVAGPRGDNMYSAQVLWDQGMADTAVKYLERVPTNPKTVFIVVAGAGHVMYGQGINGRIEGQKAGKGITVVMIQSANDVTVSKGLGDFVYVSKPTKA